MPNKNYISSCKEAKGSKRSIDSRLTLKRYLRDVPHQTWILPIGRNLYTNKGKGSQLAELDNGLREEWNSREPLFSVDSSGFERVQELTASGGRVCRQR